jgi:hypothetical protein
MDVNVLIDSPLKALLYLGSLKSGYLAVKLFAGELIASGNRSMTVLVWSFESRLELSCKVIKPFLSHFDCYSVLESGEHSMEGGSNF